MTQLLIQGEVILAQGPFEMTDGAIRTVDQVIPLHVVEGWQIVAADLPDGFRCADYAWQGELVKKPEPVVPVPVPESVTMRQATQALILAGLDDDVDAMLAAMPGVEGKLARAEWAKAQVVERDRPLVVQMGAALGLTPEQIDQLFITAATL